MLPALLRRFPDLAPAVPPDRLPFRRPAFVYGVDALPDAAGSLRTATGMPLSPARGAADRGAMDLRRVVAGTRHAAVRLWRGHGQLWDAFLSADPWDPGPAEHDARPLHWDGPVLVGTVLPGRPH